MLVKMRSLSASIIQFLYRGFLPNTFVFVLAALGQGLGLLDPVLALDAALERQYRRPIRFLFPAATWSK
jgi:hypothetical protein